MITINKQTEDGAVLFTGLITLVILSLISVSSMQGSTLEQRMAGNINDQLLAFEAAEAALLAGETLIQGGTLTTTDFTTGSSDGLYENDSDTIWNEPGFDWITDSISTGFSPTTISTSPRFVIQFLGLTDDTPLDPGLNDPIIQMYRITARGTGRSNNSIAILESTYGYTTSAAASAIPFLGRQSWRQIDF